MIYSALGDSSDKKDFLAATFSNLGKDGSLYFLDNIPQLNVAELFALKGKSLIDCAKLGASLLIGEIDPTIIESALTFDAPLKELNRELSVLELFHGPTLAFKDFAASFMAEFFSTVVKDKTILVATSGDTGGAIAQAFWKRAGFKVVVLYPSGLVSPRQEKQLCSFDDNVLAVESAGSFDHCQRIVKECLNDSVLVEKFGLLSANSINVARLIPQVFYYLRAYAQLTKENDFIAVPSGNFGNITAGLIASGMGARLGKFIAGNNSNNPVSRYLNGAPFEVRPHIATIANAMDVTNPSNFSRTEAIFKGRIREELQGASYNDEEIKIGIKELYQKFGYIACPHTSIGYLAVKDKPGQKMFLATADPAKFPEVVEPIIGKEVPLPERFRVMLERKGNKVKSACEKKSVVKILEEINS